MTSPSHRRWNTRRKINWNSEQLRVSIKTAKRFSRRARTHTHMTGSRREGNVRKHNRLGFLILSHRAPHDLLKETVKFFFFLFLTENCSAVEMRNFPYILRPNSYFYRNRNQNAKALWAQRKKSKCYAASSSLHYAPSTWQPTEKKISLIEFHRHKPFFSSFAGKQQNCSRYSVRSTVSNRARWRKGDENFLMTLAGAVFHHLSQLVSHTTSRAERSKHLSHPMHKQHHKLNATRRTRGTKSVLRSVRWGKIDIWLKYLKMWSEKKSEAFSCLHLHNEARRKKPFSLSFSVADYPAVAHMQALSTLAAQTHTQSIFH